MKLRNPRLISNYRNVKKYLAFLFAIKYNSYQIKKRLKIYLRRDTNEPSNTYNCTTTSSLLEGYEPLLVQPCSCFERANF